MKTRIILFLLLSIASLSNTNGQNHRFAHQATFLEGGTIKDMLVDDNSLLIATEGGVWKLNETDQWELLDGGFKGESKQYSNSIKQLFKWNKIVYAINDELQLFRWINNNWEVVYEKKQFAEVEVAGNDLYVLEKVSANTFNLVFYKSNFSVGYNIKNAIYISNPQRTDLLSSIDHLHVAFYCDDIGYILRDGYVRDILPELLGMSQLVGNDVDNLYATRGNYYYPNHSTNNLYRYDGFGWSEVRLVPGEQSFVYDIFNSRGQISFYSQQFGALLSTDGLFHEEITSALGYPTYTAAATTEIFHEPITHFASSSNAHFFATDGGVIKSNSFRALTEPKISTHLHTTENGKSHLKNNVLISQMDNTLGVWNYFSGEEIPLQGYSYYVSDINFSSEMPIMRGYSNSFNKYTPEHIIENVFVFEELDEFNPELHDGDIDYFIVSATERDLNEDINKLHLYLVDLDGNKQEVPIPSFINGLTDSKVIDEEVYLLGYQTDAEYKTSSSEIVLAHFNPTNPVVQKIEYGFEYNTVTGDSYYPIEQFKSNGELYIIFEERIKGAAPIFTLKKLNRTTHTFENIDLSGIKLSRESQLFPFEDGSLLLNGTTAYFSNNNKDWSLLEFVNVPAGATYKEIFYDENQQPFLSTKGNGIFSLSETATQIAELDKTTLNCYPNPTRGSVTIECPSAVKSYRVLNLNGGTVSSENIQSNASTLKIEANDLSTGTYFVFIEGMDGITYNTTFVKH